MLYALSFIVCVYLEGDRPATAEISRLPFVETVHSQFQAFNFSGSTIYNSFKNKLFVSCDDDNYKNRKMTLNVSAGVEVLLGAERPPESTVASEDMLFPWPTVAEASTFGMIWLTAVIGNGLITCTLLRRSLLTHPSNRLKMTFLKNELYNSPC